MAPVVDGIASVVEQLNERVQELERRVSFLESDSSHRTEKSVREPTPAMAVAPVERTRPPATWRGFPPPSGGIVPILGKAVLALAGAYLLRAVAESGSVPQLPVIVIAVLYAGFWMLWAIRLCRVNYPAGVTYGITSALILSPLLWEATVRFHILPPAFSGLVLAAYVLLTIAMSWRLDLQLIPWIAVVAAVNTILALVVATHALVPLIASLLALTVIVEIALCLGRPLSFRPVPALACDLALLLFIDVMTSAEGVPESYQAAAPGTITALCLALLAIYLTSIAIRVFAFRQSINVFDIAQTLLAFSLGTFGTMRVNHGAAAIPLGFFYLLLCGACYWATLMRFDDERNRYNRLVFAAWAAGLLISGAVLLLPAGFQAVFLCAAAMLAGLAYIRTRQTSIGVHTSLFLAAAAVVSPTVGFFETALAGSLPIPAPSSTVWVTAISAPVCYAVASRARESQNKQRALLLVPALIASLSAAAFVVVGMVWLMSHSADMPASRVSVIRTVVICALTLALAFLGLRWKRGELGWIAYVAVAFGTLKLLFEDLRYGNAASLVFSLLAYGLILILLPKLLGRNREQVEHSTT